MVGFVVLGGGFIMRDGQRWVKWEECQRWGSRRRLRGEQRGVNGVCHIGARRGAAID